MLTQKKLKELFHYNSTTGIFTYKVKTAIRVTIGAVAGTLSKRDGYIIIRIKPELYKAHRLAWLYVHGVWPEGDVDHKNHKRADNRIKNLRDVTSAGNAQNRIKANSNNKSTGIQNVYYCEHNNKFRVMIMTNGKNKHCGYFSTLKIAEGVALRAKRKYHSTCVI